MNQTLRHCGPNGCTHDCNSGRLCVDSLNASRRIFGLCPVHTSDGGHRISGDDSMRLDPPAVITPESAQSWCLAALAFAGVIGIALVAFAAYCGLL